MGEVIVKIDPMGAVRMTQKGKWVKPNARRYIAYKQALGAHFDQAGLGLEDIHFIVFVHPIPKSYSKKKQVEWIGEKKLTKPDIDNLVKGVFDVYKSDEGVWHILSIKVYGEEGMIVINPDDLTKWVNQATINELIERTTKYLQQ